MKQVRYRILGTISILVFSVWLILGLYAADGAFPTNPIELPFQSSIESQRWLPQGWAFFTKSPRDDKIKAWTKSDSGLWESVLTGASIDKENLFGLSRYMRAQAVEIGLLSYEAGRENFKSCTQNPVDCGQNTSQNITVRNTSSVPTICGPLIVANQKPVPWAWSKTFKEKHMPSEVIRLEVLC